MSDSQSSSDFYLTIREPASASLKDTGSRFLGLLYPVSADAEATRILNECRKKYYDATHHCYAWRIRNEQTGNIIERTSDDGEPSGTAGKPILTVLHHAGLENILCIVVRWFGGTKLGTGGLVRAYSDTAKGAVGNAVILRQYTYVTGIITADFSQEADLIRIFSQNQVRIQSTDYTDQITMSIGILPSKLALVQRLIKDHFRNQLELVLPE